MKQNGSNILLALSAAAMALCLLLASLVNTNGGSTRVYSVYLPDQQGNVIHAKIYQPKTATIATPAPAVLLVHGGGSYLETMGNYALELARRGFVAMAVDCTGSGLSDYSSGDAVQVIGNYSGLDADGGIAKAFQYLMEFDFVDSGNLALAGHSLGGTYASNAAMRFKEHVSALMVIGSGSFLKVLPTYAPEDLCFNVGYINAIYDEYVIAATGVQNTKELLDKDFVLTGFNLSQPLVPGEVSGSYEDGTARIMYMPYTSHSANVINRESIGDLTDFFTQAMGAPAPLEPTNQIWYWKETLTTIGLAFFFLFLVALTLTLVKARFFSELVVKQRAPAVQMGRGMQICGIVLLSVIPVLTLYPLGIWISKLGGSGANAVFPMLWANVFAGWAFLTSLLILALFLVWHMAYGRKHGGGLAAYGLATDNERGVIRWNVLWKSALLVVCVLSIAYVFVHAAFALWELDLRWWRFGIKPLTPLRLQYVPQYLLLYLVFCGINTMTNAVFARTNSAREGKWAVAKQYLVSWLTSTAAIFVVMVIYYGGLRLNHYPPLFVFGHPNSLSLNGNTVVMVPLFTMSTLVNTTLYRKTHNTYISWFLSALLLTLFNVAAQGFTA